MGTYYAVQGGSRILDATRVDKSGSDNTNVTAWMRTSDFILAVNINSGGNNTAAAQYKLRWRNKTDSGTFADVGSTGAINYTATTDLVNGAAIAVGGRKCDSQGGDTWQAGEEVEGASLSDSIDLADEYETEIHFGLDCSGATFGKEYEFELYDSTNGASRGTCGATITLAMGTIAYSAGTDTITVTGYTEGTPCNFTDIYNADVTGSWGQVTRQCTNQFCFDCKIQIGDGSTATWFADTKKQIIFPNGSVAHLANNITLKANSHFRLGTLSNDANKETSGGCCLYDYNAVGVVFFIIADGSLAICELYHSCFIGVSGRKLVRLYPGCTTNASKMYNCSFSDGFEISPMNASCYNVLLTNSSYAFASVKGEMDRITIKKVAGPAFYTTDTGEAAAVFKNVVVRNVTKIFKIYAAATLHQYLVNPDSDNWLFEFHVGTSARIYRQYEFDLKVIDKDNVAINGATVKIWDKDDSLVTNTTTNASGVLATQTLNYGYYNQAGGNVATMQTPHEIRIYKYGKSVLSSKSSIEKVTDWVLTMLTDGHITQTTEATVAAYTGITINHTAETITISSNHTLDEIYDYCQYDIIAATKQLDQTMHTADGVNFVSEYSFVVNTGITVTATDQKLSMVSGETYTLTGTAQFTGIIATTTTTRIPIKLTNIIDGSRYWVGKQSDGSKIFEGTQSGSGTVTGYYEHTANINIDIRVRKSSASTKYKPWIGEGTLVAEAFSLRIRQIQDSIVT